jgi:PAS domain S-box-containing protein
VSKELGTLVLKDSTCEAIFDNASDGIVLADPETKRFHLGNKTICQMLGYSEEELKTLHLKDIHPERDIPYVVEQFEKMVRKEIKLAMDIPVKRQDGSVFYADINSFPLITDGKQYIIGLFRDVSDRKKTEESLKEKEKELEIKAQNLEEANIALKVLLKRRNEDTKELEEKVLLNVKELVMPYLEKLKMSGLDERQKTYLDILESSLNQIISPFSLRMSSKFLNFTHKELQVANLLREGRTNKEIGELLNASPRTIACHRENIRKKLGLTNKKANLKSYLLSINT